MQMKTAMQELIQSLKAEQMIASNEWQMGYQKALSNVILEIESMLEKEKEQIEDAHIEGQRVFDEYPHTQWTNDQAEAYYKKTYNKQ
jgi:ribosome-associated translation inhibitor RaiA